MSPHRRERDGSAVSAPAQGRGEALFATVLRPGGSRHGEHCRCGAQGGGPQRSGQNRKDSRLTRRGRPPPSTRRYARLSPRSGATASRRSPTALLASLCKSDIQSALLTASVPDEEPHRRSDRCHSRPDERIRRLKARGPPLLLVFLLPAWQGGSQAGSKATKRGPWARTGIPTPRVVPISTVTCPRAFRPTDAFRTTIRSAART